MFYGEIFESEGHIKLTHTPLNNSDNAPRLSSTTKSILFLSFTGLILCSFTFAQRQVQLNSTSRAGRMVKEEVKAPNLTKDQQSDFVVTISTVAREDEKSTKYNFREGETVSVKINVKNLSNETAYIPKGPGFSRPILYRNGQLVPYLDMVNNQFNESQGGVVIGLLSPKSNQSLSEVIDLTDFYEPLKPGEYQLVLDRRFFKIGGIESNATMFTVSDTSFKIKTPSASQKTSYGSDSKQKTGTLMGTMRYFKESEKKWLNEAPKITVELERKGKIFFLTSNELGRYLIDLETGNYCLRSALSTSQRSLTFIRNQDKCFQVTTGTKTRFDISFKYSQDASLAAYGTKY